MKDEDVCKALSNAEINYCEERSNYELKLMGTLSRKTYDSVARVLRTMRGEWNKELQTHVFWKDPTCAIARYLVDGTLPVVNPLAFFPTPEEVVEFMLNEINCPENFPEAFEFLEPNAGDGRIAAAIQRRLPGAQVDCVELDPENQSVLAWRGFNVVGEDFLNYNPLKHYDFIVMNPPFQSANYERHILHAWGMLKSNGVLVSVVPSGFRRIQKFRNLVFEFGGADNIGSPFEGTSVECEVITLRNCDTQHLWLPNDGYASTYARSIEILLENEAVDLPWETNEEGQRDFYLRAQKPISKPSDVDQIVERLITKEGRNLLWNDRVRRQVLGSFLNHIEEGQLALL